MKKSVLVSFLALGMLAGCADNEVDNSAFEENFQESTVKVSKTDKTVEKMFVQYEKEFNVLGMKDVIRNGSTFEDYLNYYAKVLSDNGVDLTSKKSSVTLELISKEEIDSEEDVKLYKVEEKLTYLVGGREVQQQGEYYYILRMYDEKWFIVDRIANESAGSEETILPDYLEVNAKSR